MIKAVSALILGGILGTLGARYLFVGSAHSLIPWSLAGLLLGYWCKSRKEAVIIGILYGFALVFSFMLAGYQGVAPLVTRIAPFAVLGLVGAFCGFVLTEISVSLKPKVNTRLIKNL